MHTVINIIFLCHFSRQLNLDCLHPLRLPCRTGNPISIHPIEPTIRLGMYTILDSTCIFLVQQLDPDCFHSLCKTLCSTVSSSQHTIEPAIRLHMSLILYQRLNIRFIHRPGSFSTLCHKHDLHSFQTLCCICRTGNLSIFCPIQPAIGLHMGTIIYIIMLFHLPGQSHLQSFHSFCLSHSTGNRSVRYPVKPAIALYMGSVLHRAAIFLVRQLDTDCFCTFLKTNSSCGCAVHCPVFPSIRLHMGTVSNIPRTGC